VQPPQTAIVVVDVSALTEPDAVILDALVRLQLAARRLGTSIRLQNPCPELVDLLALVGLSDVLLVDCGGSGVEMDRQAEHREEVLVDEEVDTRDATA
jgi:anti-anti-sigma regulatory factor